MPRKRKVYLLSREEREEVWEFIKKQLRKEYIRLSKLLQTAPVFFVRKKDGKKRMVQDYQHLNKWTIKNNYLLPLILNIIKKIEDKEEHNKLVAEIIKRLEKNNLYVKPEKYKWKMREVRFLGVVIGLEGIKIEKEKVKGILDWPTPKYIKDIQKFLELANYYCWFIQGFAFIVRPLHNIVRKDQKWK